MEIAPIAVIVVARAFLRQPQALVNKPGQLAMLFRSHADVHRPPPRPWPSDECGCCEPKVIDDRLAAHLGDDGALFGRDHVLRCYLPMLPGREVAIIGNRDCRPTWTSHVRRGGAWRTGAIFWRCPNARLLWLAAF